MYTDNEILFGDLSATPEEPLSFWQKAAISVIQLGRFIKDGQITYLNQFFGQENNITLNFLYILFNVYSN